MGAVTYDSGRLSRGGALAQGFLSLANQRPLVALHALQLLVSSHAATGQSSRWVRHVHQVQRTVRPGLSTPGGRSMSGLKRFAKPSHLADWAMGGLGPHLRRRSLPQSDKRRHRV